MRDLAPYELNIVFRAGHSYVWELADKSGILSQMHYLPELDQSGFIDELIQEQPVSAQR